MIYLDNSATTFPKPANVVNAVTQTLKFYSANPGRSGHKLSLLASKKVFNCRQKICKLFNVPDVSNVIFTSCCTHSLNIVIKGVLKSGDHCIISDLEHNSVLRPLDKLKKIGVSYTVAKVYEGDDDKTIESFRKCITEKTKLIICTHASNVFGIRLPVERICSLAHKHGVLFCLDAAQSAGVFDIDVDKSDFDFVCCAGHKGLYGPMGVGVLVINSDVFIDSLIEGGTGSLSQYLSQPDFLPDRFESGTLNVPGICGLSSGVDYLAYNGIDKLYQREIKLIQYLYTNLKNNSKIKLHTSYPDKYSYAPVLSFSVNSVDSETVSSYLSNKYNIATRAGLHCSYLAHKKMKTSDKGTVRVSVSAFNTINDIEKLIFAVNNFDY